ncbi:MAG TPA: HK97-gp10 family putative phage morphogenesis protein [Phycisphaerae bacterium]|nr:HK97-gp10 family putative phage morphogenesis protein [Phycisphaerae bacterium]
MPVLTNRHAIIGPSPQELARLMMELPADIQKRIVASALRKAAAPIVARAQWNAPVRSGTLMQSIRSSGVKRMGNAWGLEITPKGGWYTGRTFYGGILEFGSSTRPALAFVRRAMEAGKDEATQILNTEIRAGADRAIRRMQRNTRKAVESMAFGT